MRATPSSRLRNIFALLLVTVLLAAGGSSARAQPRLPMDGFADLVDRLTPAVVNIATRQRVYGMREAPRPPRGSPLERMQTEGEDGAPQIVSLGSGFLISADGDIITNNHVIQSADAIDVILQNGETYPARVVGRDPATDIALLHIERASPFPFVTLGDSDSARVGDLVLAIGNPFGLGGSVSLGIVSARNRNIEAGRYDDFLQTDAAINRGNSGGPLFNTRGEVIGVNTAIVTPNGESVGVGFATPAGLVRPVIAQLRRFGETRRGWLGVRLNNLSAEDARRAGLNDRMGAIVTAVTPGGPAERAGLRVGDIVRAFAGNQVRDSRAMTRMVGQADIDAPAPIDLIRGRNALKLTALIARQEEADPDEPVQSGADSGGGPRGGRLFGLTLSELDAGLRANFQVERNVRGLIVTGLDPDLPEALGFRVGDVLEAIGPTPLTSIEDARALAVRAGRERGLVVRINRGGRTSYRVVRARDLMPEDLAPAGE